MVSKKELRFKSKSVSPQSGFTLVEVAVGAFIGFLGMMCMIGSMLIAMKVSLQARFQDRAMNALVSVADQFQNSVPNIPGNAPLVQKTLFADTNAGPTGIGMGWDNVKHAFAYPTGNVDINVTDGGATDLAFSLGTVGTSDGTVMAHLTRDVHVIADASGSATAGILKEATFTLKYTFFFREKALQIKVLRNINPSD